MPGHAKIVSVMTAPVSTTPNCRPRIVTIGIRLLRKRVMKDGARARDAFRARGQHVRLAQLFEQARARHASQNGGERGAEGRRRQHEMRKRAASPDRQPAELDGKHNREQRPEPEVRNRDTDERQRHRAVVDGRAAPDGGDDAERQRNQHGDGHRGERELGGGGHALENLLQHRLIVSQRHAEIAAHQSLKKRCRTARAAAGRGRDARGAARRLRALRLRRASPAPDRRG